MRWFLAILLFSIFTFFLTILGVIEFWKLEGERDRAFKVMSLRENLAYVLSYYGKDEALLKSHLNLSKNLALEIGDGDLVGFTEKIKKRTEGIIKGGRNTPYWLYALFIALFSILACIILDLRLGILWERSELGGDFEECSKGCQVLIE
jgi:hypothetical protein